MRRLEGDFWCWAVGNLREGGGDVRPTPLARPDEGAAHLLVCLRSPALSRWRVLKLFLDMDDGGHLRAHDVHCYRMRRLRLWPSGGGHVQLSGQELRRAPFELTVERGVARVFY